ncbi:MAG: M14 family metallopeptidase [Gemmatimonadota bacterium]
MKRSRWALALALACLAAAFTRPAPAAAQELSGYHDYDALTRELRGLVNAHPELARLTSIGRTLENRDIWAVELANRSGTPLAERPALLITANLEGNQVVGSELALRTVASLLGSYATDADVRDRLDNHVIYVVPRVNPDGAERMFAATREELRGNANPRDADNDVRVDEDGPDDLNGDGLITLMRVADPHGAFRPDSADARLMVRADAARGEAGGWTLYTEGLDNDGDGFYNEDGPGGVDINRNFQHAYPYYQPDAGPHMVSERESRALMDYVLGLENVALILSFGESDNLVRPPNQRGELAAPATVDLADFAVESLDGLDEVGVFSTGGGGFGGFGGFGGGGSAAGQSGGRPSGGRQPATTVNAADQEYFRRASDSYRELTGIDRVLVTRAPAGAFADYGYYQFGVPSFTTPGFGVMDGEEVGEGDGDAALLAWLEARGIDGFVDWTPFQHPTLGQVEIGGFQPYVLSNPPAADLEALGRSHAGFTVWLGSLFPEVRVADTQVTNHGGGIFRITAEVENAGYLPTSTAHGVVARAVRPTMVQLGVDPDAIITGDAKTNFIQALDGSGRRQSYTWLIRGNAGDRIELRVRSQKAGLANATIVLQ